MTTQSDQVILSKIQPKQLMLWRDLEGRTKGRTTKELQELDPLGSPHLEEKLIGGNLDLDLLSLFPQRYARIMGGIEREASFLRSTMVGERGKTCWKKLWSLWGRRGPFIGPHEKESLQTAYTGDSGCPDRRLRS